MSVNRVLAAAIAMTVLAGLQPLPAQEGKPQQLDPAKAAAELQRQMIARFDLNKDGVLGPEEQLAAQEALRRQGGAAGLGLVPGGFPGAEQFLKQFDRDGDGKLSDTEKLAASAAFQKMRGADGGVQRGALPGAGNLPTGGAAIPAGGQAEGKPAKVSPLVKRFDLDGDGKLNDTEKAAAQAEFNKKKGKTSSKEKSAKKDEKPAEKP
jgi:hypothetical protein